MEEENNETTKYTELITICIQRLEKIWQEGEGDLTIEIRDDKGKKARVRGGETVRV